MPHINAVISPSLSRGTGWFIEVNNATGIFWCSFPEKRAKLLLPPLDGFVIRAISFWSTSAQKRAILAQSSKPHCLSRLYLKTYYQLYERLKYFYWKKRIIKDFLKHVVYPFQTAKHLEDQWSGIYEMIYCVSDHLDTPYQWISFLCHRKNICFHPWPKPTILLILSLRQNSH